jgi:hypothetical protein
VTNSCGILHHVGSQYGTAYILWVTGNKRGPQGQWPMRTTEGEQGIELLLSQKQSAKSESQGNKQSPDSEKYVCSV